MMSLTAGSPSPAGAYFDGHGINFTLFSAHAHKVELCIFDQQGREQRYTLPMRSGDIWHGYLSGGQPGLTYGYRVYGPWEPSDGHRFNPAKLLLDPCARLVTGGVSDHPVFHSGDETPDLQDSAPQMAKCVVVQDSFDWRGDVAPRIPWSDSVIYEAHVRGLTMRHPDIPPALRGTYAALGHPVMLAYFKRLGITALELLPVAHFVSEPHVLKAGLINYWGYNPRSFYAVEGFYATEGKPERAADELRTAIKTLHQHGIEVILDVVLNHSAELGVDGPTFSLRGIDNRSYYWLTSDGGYQNWTGCGNTLNLSTTAVVEQMVDCLSWWVESFHIDGFRFDLATVMGRTPTYQQNAPLFEAIKNTPCLSQIKLIAEPWDIGPGGYQAGHFPAPFVEWNDRFRDGMRRFWLRHDLCPGLFARRFSASSDRYRNDQNRPSHSVNYVTAHDGFTLRDCVSFNQKHNDVNGESNRDGSSNNYSNNHGFEGMLASMEIEVRRQASVRALLTSLLLAQGVPMLLAGDEHGRSQQGNNNAYCQDNELTWHDWEGADNDLIAFTAALIHLRKTIPALMLDEWWNERDDNVRWLNQAARPLNVNEWQNGIPRIQIQLSRHWLIAINATSEAAELTLPEGEWSAIPPFTGEGAPVMTSVWHGPAHGICVFKKQEKGVGYGAI